MPHLLIFGLGYTASRIAERLRADGWRVDATGSAGNLDFDDVESVNLALGEATHIVSSVPPENETGLDPVLGHYGRAIATAPAQWIGYLSSTGVYGDANGAWVDESAPIGTGRREARSAADASWQDLGQRVRVFRLPGIYGPGRSVLDRLRSGKAQRIDAKDQVFSRIYVNDIAGAVVTSFDGPAGVYNVTDDLPAPNHEVIAYGAQLSGLPVPPLIPLDEAGLSPMAMGFYAENRRVANDKAKRLLGWQPQFANYKDGLTDILRGGG